MDGRELMDPIVEVQKITAPKPKEISTRGRGKKEEMVSPKGLKPKKHKQKRQAQKFMRKEEGKKKKRSLDQKIEDLLV